MRLFGHNRDHDYYFRLLGEPIWSEDSDLFGSGVAVWANNRVEIFLEAQLRSLTASEEE